jgi:hypothetical protein
VAAFLAPSFQSSNYSRHFARCGLPSDPSTVNDWCHKIIPFGRPEVIADHIARHFEAGADHVTLLNLSPDPWSRVDESTDDPFQIRELNQVTAAFDGLGVKPRLLRPGPRPISTPAAEARRPALGPEDTI